MASHDLHIVLRDQGALATLAPTNVPIPATVTALVSPKVTVTTQLDSAASSLSADPSSIVSLDIDPSQATLVTDPNVHGSKFTISTGAAIALIIVGAVAVVAATAMTLYRYLSWDRGRYRRRQQKRASSPMVVKAAEINRTLGVKHMMGSGSPDSFIGGSYKKDSAYSTNFLDERPLRFKPAWILPRPTTSSLKSPPPAYVVAFGFPPSTPTSSIFPHHQSTPAHRSVQTSVSPGFATLPVSAHVTLPLVNSLMIVPPIPLTTTIASSHIFPDPLAAAIQIFPYEIGKEPPSIPISPTSQFSLPYPSYPNDALYAYSGEEPSHHQRSNEAFYGWSRAQRGNGREEEGDVPFTSTITSGYISPDHPTAAIQAFPNERAREPSTTVSPTSQNSLRSSYSDDASLYSFFGEEYSHQRSSGASYRWSRAQGEEVSEQEGEDENATLDAHASGVTHLHRSSSTATDTTTFRSPLLRDELAWSLFPPTNRTSILESLPLLGKGKADKVVSPSPSSSGSHEASDTMRLSSADPFEFKQPKK